VQKVLLALIAAGTVVLAGCGPARTSQPLSHGDRLTAAACKDIVATMTPTEGSGTIQLGMPFQRMVEAVGNAPNGQLRSELAAFQAAAATGGDFAKDSSAMLQTCKRLGFGGSTG
jgi:hypothetical protein